MPDGRVATATRAANPMMKMPLIIKKPAKWTVYAEYLHEILGLAVADGWLYAIGVRNHPPERCRWRWLGISLKP